MPEFAYIIFSIQKHIGNIMITILSTRPAGGGTHPENITFSIFYIVYSTLNLANFKIKNLIPKIISTLNLANFKIENLILRIISIKMNILLRIQKESQPTSFTPNNKIYRNLICEIKEFKFLSSCVNCNPIVYMYAYSKNMYSYTCIIVQNL